MSFKNYYIILEVKNTASSEEIKQAFRKLAKQYHPDKNHGNNSAEEFFKEIQEAYAVLSDQEKRKKYDLKFAYANNYQQIKNKSRTPYTGNAYQYAQQQAQAQHEHRNRQPEQQQTKTVKEHKSGTDPYLFIISIVVAILLLLFIVFYSSK